MKLLLIFAFTFQLTAQTCSHVLTRTPNGPVLVYRAGKLLTLNTDYTSIAFGPITITPLAWSDGDKMSAVFSRAVPLGFTFQGQTISYWGYQLWREDWACVGQSGTVTLTSPFPGCTSDGNQGIACAGGIALGVGTQFARSLTFSGINFLLPNDPAVDPTGKSLKDSGVAPCDGMDPKAVGGLPCHQLIWQ